MTPPVPNLARPPAAPDSSVTHCGDASHRRVGNLHVLKLSGTPYEMTAERSGYLVVIP